MNDNFEDIIIVDEEMVDIASQDNEIKPRKKGRYAKNTYNGREANQMSGNKKKIIIISSVAATVVAALGVTGFCLYQSGMFDFKDPAAEFVFDENAVVSGIPIGGKTMAQAKAALEASQQSFIRPIDITVDTNGDVTNLTQSDFEYTFNIDEVLTTVKNDETNPDAKKSNEPKTYVITATATDESIQKNVKSIEEKSNTEPKNAYVSKFHPYEEKRFEYEEAVQGCKVNAEDLKTQLATTLNSNASATRIVTDVETVDAKISVDDIKKNVKKLASYETHSTNTANGNENMRLSLKACNGSIIEPGATWSFNECTGDSNLESRGYKPATVIADGQTTQGVGGGICQSSSTIYNAGIRAGMDVEERYCHKWASAYVPTGLDATIDYPRLDLKLSNPTDYQMFMECKFVDSELYVTIWGVRPDWYDEIKTANSLDSTGGSSYSVSAWRVYYKDGKEVKREELDGSSYDIDHGVVFIPADVDGNAVDRDVDDLEEDESNSDESSSSSHASSSGGNNSGGGNSGSSSSSQATQPPTEAETEAPPATQPEESEPDVPESDVPVVEEN